MKTVLFILTISFLLLIAYQDLKSYTVSWIIFPVLIIVMLASGLRQIEFKTLLINAISNLGIVAVQLVLLSAYFSIKEKRFINIINTKIGLGDVLFFIAICMAFSTLNFILFLFVSLVFSLMLAILLNQKTRLQSRIPLAGYMSISYIIFMMIQILTKFDAYGMQLIDYIIN